jgi:hypothetical protein
MAAGNGDTQALQAIPVPENGDHIFQTLTSPKKTLEDMGLVKAVLVYMDQGIQRVVQVVVPHSTLDKVTNTLEDEAVG